MQYIFIFGKAVKIDDDFTIEVDSPAIPEQILDHTLYLLISGIRLIIYFLGLQDLESECIKTDPSEKLAEIGLALLKNVSSHKGLT